MVVLGVFISMMFLASLYASSEFQFIKHIQGLPGSMIRVDHLISLLDQSY